VIVPVSRCELGNNIVDCKKNKNDRWFSMEEDIRIGGGRLWALLAGVFLISFSLLAFEISLTRVLSVMLFYHYVFIVISPETVTPGQ